MMIALLFAFTIQASLLHPIFKCTNKKESFTFILNEENKGELYLKKASCLFTITSTSQNHEREGLNGKTLRFHTQNCPSEFSTEGFLKLEEMGKSQYRAHALALKNYQGISCITDSVDLKRLKAIFDVAR
ncbi:MAG: hypothetical protein ACOYL6_18845 [Bacteriovoracaceae bacterium]